VDTTTRRAEARAALSDLIERYRDVLGPQCWCSDVEDCETRPCPAIPASVNLDAWLLSMEWADLDPYGSMSTSVHTSHNCGANRALGLAVRARDFL
jgi:hypothetical protein